MGISSPLNHPRTQALTLPSSTSHAHHTHANGPGPRLFGNTESSELHTGPSVSFALAGSDYKIKELAHQSPLPRVKTSLTFPFLHLRQENPKRFCLQFLFHSVL